jgi:DNA-binding transcriptional MerR regulator
MGSVPKQPADLRIGEVARRLGVSTRTLRYYEELGLVAPSDRSPGGSRRYAEVDVERIVHIRELQQVLGFDLDQIGQMLEAEDRLDVLRTEYRNGPSAKRQAAILQECVDLNQRLQALVGRKMGQLEGMLAELKAKARRYEEVAAEKGLDVHHTAVPSR